MINSLKNISTRERGFTIIEMVIYMTLLIVLITILSFIFSFILDTQLESKSMSSVEQDGSYMVTKLIYDMRLMETDPPISDLIVTPSSPGSTDSTLNFTVNSINYIYSLNNGNFQLVNDKGTNNLNSSDTTVSDLQFTRIGNGGSNDTIRVNFTLTSRVRRNSGAETRAYQTIISSQ